MQHSPAVRIIQIFPDRIDALCVDSGEGDILSPSKDVLVLEFEDRTDEGGLVAHPVVVGELVRLPLKQGSPLQLKRALDVFIREHGGVLLLSKQEPFAAVPAAKAHVIAKRLKILDFHCEATRLRNAAEALGRNGKAQPETISGIREGECLLVKTESGQKVAEFFGVKKFTGGENIDQEPRPVPAL